ncbi:MAG: isoprenylcysteine carboxylmethyltransferase family protein [Acidobacteria bacterium]|nr:isoprenylcysteine carboxylmethyltransferase family protein [Acidobacteriota bacterium]
MSERSKTLGWIRLAGLYAFVIALVILSHPSPASLAVGAIAVALGESVRLWAAGHLVKSVRLVTSGPYAWTQCPLYLGRLLILTGLGLAAHHDSYVNLVALGIGYAIFFFYYMPRKIRVEGARLTKIHGDAYEQYSRSVPLLFPSLKRYPGDGSTWSFRRMVRNQEPLILLGLLVTLSFLYWKMTRG